MLDPNALFIAEVDRLSKIFDLPNINKGAYEVADLFVRLGLTIDDLEAYLVKACFPYGVTEDAVTQNFLSGSLDKDRFLQELKRVEEFNERLKIHNCN